MGSDVTCLVLQAVEGLVAVRAFVGSWSVDIRLDRFSSGL